MSRSMVWLLTSTAILTLGCQSVPAPRPTVDAEETSAHSAARGVQAPSGDVRESKGPARISGEGSITYQASGPFPVDLATIPARQYDPFNKLDLGKEGGRPRSPVSAEKLAELRAKALTLPPNPYIQEVPLSQYKAVTVGTTFEALDYTDCCGGGGSAPPDPELAVGPNHIIAVVNTAFAIYDKSGALLSGPTTFSSFFNGTTGCSNTGVFDPNALYDEEEDRFIIAIDGNGTDYCIAATTGSDPTSTWNRFAFATDINGNFFDFPHAGVGLDAIYMGSNQFLGQSFAEARVFAIEKAPLYSGGTPTIVTHSTGSDGTPQPANLHGFNQGTWPSGGPHYLMTETYDGVTHSVWSWSDPFGANSFSKVGDVDLGAATGVPGALPIDWPQAGSSADLQGNDYRGQSTEYRNGSLWMSNTLGCNPGGGTVNCVRWAQIDPTGPTVLDAGVFGTDDEYRVFPNVSANHCDDMGIGYTKGSSSTFASVYVAGRESGDSAGSLQTETLIKAGEVTYSSFSNDPAPHRWGDYTKMTIDPDGVTFWYLGEYSKDTGSAQSKWGTYISSFSFPACSIVPQTCGNGVVEGNEVCDVGELEGETCSSQGCTGGGTLACNATCDGYDTSSCLDCQVSNGPQDATYDSGLGAPACAIAGSSCDSVALLDGVSDAGPEPNEPNTLDSCTDGTSGSYHSDESNDRLVVSTLDGTDMSEGATVRVDATVWAWTTPSSDTLDLYYAADASNPTWVFIDSITPSSAGAQTLSATYTLPSGSQQAVRANFRYQGSQSSCSGGNYDDADDLVFAVGTVSECTIDDDCDDGAYCNGAETCNAGSCQAGTAIDCSDGVSCTIDACNEASDSCDNTPDDSLCDNGLFCDGAETCDAVNDCQAGSDPCPSQTCDEVGDVCGGGGTPVEVTLISIAGEDGWARESNETSNVGGASNSGGAGARPIRPGDGTQDRQYKSILSFDTSSIPATATIQSAVLRLQRGTVRGLNPFTNGFGQCLVDVQSGGFSGSTALSASDFEAAATATAAAAMSAPAANGDWSEGSLSASGLAAINTSGTTQLRVYFEVDDNDNGADDHMGYYSSNNSVASRHPQLVVTYIP